MVDSLSSEERSARMRLIKERNTGPELAIRKILRDLNFPGYRLHRKDLPGRPDIAYIGKRKAVFVHGCFWHGHDCKIGARKPKSNLAYWLPKIERTRQRDAEHLIQLEHRGWCVLTVWECELRKPATLAAKLAAFLSECEISKPLR